MAENGTASRMMTVFTADPVLKYSSRKTMNSVIGTTIFSRSRTRSMYSYWPLQTSWYPAGTLTFSGTTFFASLHVAADVAPGDIHVDVAAQAAVFVANHARPGLHARYRRSAASGICAPEGVLTSTRCSAPRSLR